MLTTGFKNSESSSRFRGEGGLATPAALGPGALALPIEAGAPPADVVGGVTPPVAVDGDIAGAIAAIQRGTALVDLSSCAKLPCKGWGTDSLPSGPDCWLACNKVSKAAASSVVKACVDPGTRVGFPGW